MGDESLREQLTAQIRAEFEGQLRELKRQKNLTEEELEKASDAWRAERRRLKAEIDKLEDDLSRVRKPSAGGSEEVKRAFEEKFQKAAAEWEAERKRLSSERERLAVELTHGQAALADAIARSSNPARETQPLREEYELKLAQANKSHLEAERQFLRARADWEEDKKKIMAELTALRRFAPSNILKINSASSGRLGSVEEVRIRELEAQLTEARASAVKSNQAALLAAEELATAKKELVRLNHVLSESETRAIEQLRYDYDAKIQELTQQKSRLAQELTGRSGLPEPGSEPSSVSQAAVPNDTESIKVEVERVEAAIKAIEKLFDEPDTTVSTIARKNVERAELQAYLQGVLFQSGRAKGHSG